MKKTFRLLAVVFGVGLSLIWSSSLLAAPEPFSMPPGGAPGEGATVCESFSPTGWDTVEASWLIGRSVSSPAGGDLGQISDLMIDRTDGHIALVMLSDVPGLGTGFVAAPFSAFERTGENVFQLSLDDRDVGVTDTYTDPYAYELGRSRSTVGLATIPQSIDSSWVAAVYRFYGRTPYWSEDKEPQLTSYRTAQEKSSIAGLFRKETTPALMGSMVQSNDGKPAGRIEDMVIDTKDDRAVLLVLGKVPSCCSLWRSDALVAVPFGEVSISGNAFALNTTEDKLAAAPGFNEETDLHDAKWAENVYKFFSQQPCWTE